MKEKIAIIYASVDGHTKKICEQLHTILAQAQIPTELHPIDQFNHDLLAYHTLVIGASVRYGKHNKAVSAFISNNRDILDEIQTAFFSVNLVARKKEKNTPSTNPYMIKFLDQMKWEADLLQVFAGKLDYKSYSFLDSLMIKLIMLITKGPTTSEAPIEFTDWERVHDFGLRILEQYRKAQQHKGDHLPD